MVLYDIQIYAYISPSCIIGVGATTPALDAFASTGESAMFTLKILDTLNSSDSAFGSVYSNAHTLGHVSETRIKDVAQYVGTPAVARDMLSIVKAYGEEKLQYWGFS